MKYGSICYNGSAILSETESLTAISSISSSHKSIMGRKAVLSMPPIFATNNFQCIPLGDLTFIAAGIDMGRAADVGSIVADTSVNKGFLGLGIWKISVDSQSNFQDMTLIKALLTPEQARIPGNDDGGEWTFQDEMTLRGEITNNPGYDIKYTEPTAYINLGKFWFIDIARWHNELPMDSYGDRKQMRRYIGFVDVEGHEFIDCQNKPEVIEIFANGAYDGIFRF